MSACEVGKNGWECFHRGGARMQDLRPIKWILSLKMNVN